MSVFVQTSIGALVVDVDVHKTPMAAFNFLKLCKIQYYTGSLFLDVQPGFVAQTGDPCGKGCGGVSIYGLLDTAPQAIPGLFPPESPPPRGMQAVPGPPRVRLLAGEEGGVYEKGRTSEHRFFPDEISILARHTGPGLLAMANGGPGANGSQFYLTLGERTPSLAELDGKHTVFARVAEDLDNVLPALSSSVVLDKQNRPLRNIRIQRTEILVDPYPDPPGMDALIPSGQLSPWRWRALEVSLTGSTYLDDGVDEVLEAAKAAEAEDPEVAAARRRAQVLEIIGDLPSADVAPPENVLFVCKLNPVTQEDDLELIFSQFGRVLECSIIRDKENGASLGYGFVGFELNEDCERAYFKMNGAIIDSRRIKVDFSQSVAKVSISAHVGATRVGSKRGRTFQTPRSDHVSHNGLPHQSGHHKRRKKKRRKRKHAHGDAPPPPPTS